MTDTVESSLIFKINESLLAPVMDEEVRCALFQMHHSKSPGPNGMSPLFCQKFWHIVGEDLVYAVRDFFSTGNFSRKCVLHMSF